MPFFYVLIGGVIVAPGTVVQLSTDRTRVRKVTPYATTTAIRLKEVGVSSSDALPAAIVSYDVMVFRDPDVVPGQPLFQSTPSNVSLGYGRITSEQRPIRRVVGAEAYLALPYSRSGDIRNGAYRTIFGGVTKDWGTYTGSFFTAESIKVAY